MSRIILRSDLKLEGVDLARLARFPEVWPARALAEFFRVPGSLAQFIEMAQAGRISPEGAEPIPGVLWRTPLSTGIWHGYGMEDVARFYAHRHRYHGEWSDTEALERGWQMLLGDFLFEVLAATRAKPERKKKEVKVTKIPWCDESWNPVTGCTKISAGCRNCYAETMSKRLQAMGQPNYLNGFDVTTHEHVLSLPHRWRQPRKVFVCSMSDLFHEEVPDSFLDAVFDVVREVERYTYLVLTKRPERMADYFRSRSVPGNCWLGVTVENQEMVARRVLVLRGIDAPVRFVSCEPLLERVDLEMETGNGIGWVIAGSEQAPRGVRREMSEDWVRDLRDQCARSGAAFFYKQAYRDGVLDPEPELDGQTWREFPAGRQGALC